MERRTWTLPKHSVLVDGFIHHIPSITPPLEILCQILDVCSEDLFHVIAGVRRLN